MARVACFHRLHRPACCQALRLAPESWARAAGLRYGLAVRWLLVVVMACASDPRDPPMLDDGAMLDVAPTADAGVDVNSPDAPPTDAEPAQAVTGRVLYEKRLFDTGGFTGAREMRPARRVRVALISTNGDLIAESLTDPQGGFRFELAASTGDMVRVRAWADARFESQRATAEPFVTGSTTYFEDSAEFPMQPTQIDVVATVNSGRGGAFNIVDNALLGLELVQPHIPSPTPHIVYGWEMGQSWSCGSCYGDNYIQLGGQVEDPDEYDDDIVLHELAHHFVEHHSADDSPGGSHRDRQVEPTLAYGEGAAYFFSCLVLGRPVILDNYLDDNRYIDIEKMTMGDVSRSDFLGTVGNSPTGRLREEIVAGIMWDAYDAASTEEPFDTIELGLEGMMEILVGYFGTWPHADRGALGIDLADFLHALQCRDDVTTAQVQALADDRQFPWTPASCE